MILLWLKQTPETKGIVYKLGGENPSFLQSWSLGLHKRVQLLGKISCSLNKKPEETFVSQKSGLNSS